MHDVVADSVQLQEPVQQVFLVFCDLRGQMPGKNLPLAIENLSQRDEMRIIVSVRRGLGIFFSQCGALRADAVRNAASPPILFAELAYQSPFDEAMLPDLNVSHHLIHFPQYYWS